MKNPITAATSITPPRINPSTVLPPPSPPSLLMITAMTLLLVGARRATKQDWQRFQCGAGGNRVRCHPLHVEARVYRKSFKAGAALLPLRLLAFGANSVG